MLAIAHQRARILAGPTNHSGALEQVPPNRDGVVAMVAETPQANAAPSPQLGPHERDVDHSEKRVIADEERAALGNVLDAVELGLGDPLQWRKDGRQPIHLGVGRSWRERRGWGNHLLTTAAAARAWNRTRALRLSRAILKAAAGREIVAHPGCGSAAGKHLLSLGAEVCLSQSHRSGSESVHIGGAPAVGFGFL